MVAALISSFTPEDADLVVALTDEERAHREADQTSGAEVLLACCWLLFMIGRVEDTVVTWRAKNIDFDTYCYIDSVFLIPCGVEATVQFARRHGHTDLAEWVDTPGMCDSAEQVEGWREGSYFRQVPSADSPAEELAAWMVS